MKLPDFIIAGATRSGTSTLFEALSRNDNLFLPKQKELHFFCRDADYGRGQNFYASYFKSAPKAALCGDISPTYLTHGFTQDDKLNYRFQPANDSAVRLHQTLPDTKIIITLRNPATRAHSFFWRTVWQGHDTAESFEQAVEEELSGKRKPEHTPLCPLFLSQYKTHLAHWLNHFDKDHILLLVMEEWTRESAKTIRRIEDFIGAPHSNLQDCDIEQTNEGRSLYNPFFKPLTRIAPKTRFMRKLTRNVLSKPGYKPLNPQTLKNLAPIFEQDIVYVENWLGRPLPAWRAT